MRSLRSQNVKGDTVGVGMDFNIAAMTPELSGWTPNPQGVFHHPPPVKVRLNDFPDVQT